MCNYPRALRRARLRIEFLRAQNCALQKEVDSTAFDLLPVMVQARNDQLNAECEKLLKERDEARAQLNGRLP